MMGTGMTMGLAELAADDKADWSTAYKNDLPDSAFLYIEPGGTKDADGKTTPRSLRHFPVKGSDGKVDSAHVTAAERLISGSNVSDSAKASALAKAHKLAGSGKKDFNPIEAVGDAIHRIGQAIGLIKQPGVTTWSLKEQPDGRLRFFALPTNCFEDKMGDIFSTKAHEGYVAWAEAKQFYPELWVWHTPGTKFGQVDWMDVNEGILAASGLIDVGMEDIARSFSPDDGMSHGFVYADKKDGVIDQYWSYELSVLPRKYAANAPTAFSLVEGENMGFNADRKAYLKDKWGVDDAKIAEWEQGTEQLAANMKALGISWKSADDEEVVAAETAAAVNTDTVLKQVVEDQQNIIKALGTITAQLVETKELATSANKSLDAAVANTIAAQVSQIAQVTTPSQNPENLITGTKEAAKADEWFSNIMGQFERQIA
jgi:hypothetical protein